jgi:hypothetical protein
MVPIVADPGGGFLLADCAGRLRFALPLVRAALRYVSP